MGKRPTDSWPVKRCASRVPHTGVVFVHGVGFQEARDTLANAVAPIVTLIREGTTPPVPQRDPVIRAKDSASDDGFPLVELEVTAGSKTQHWVLTEAWWAKSFREPSVASMFTWLGPGSATARVARRLRWRSTQVDCQDDVERFRSTRPQSLNELAEVVILSVLTTAGLLAYSVLKLVFAILPVGALREATIGPFERFVTGWAGDMRVLVADEAQAAMIRRRIADACRETVRLGCDRIVIVAHSGGAVASYMTLTDQQYQDLPVARLITFGAGLNIAWRLLALRDDSADEPAGRIGGLLAEPLPASVAGTWDDFWASDDPVPAGPISDPPRTVQRPRVTPGSPCTGVRIYNRLNLREDHGGYFDNDEEFLVPVATAIHDVAREASDPRLMQQDRVADIVRLRRERVAGLAMWRQFCVALAAVAVVGSVATGVINYWSASRLGLPLEDVAAAFLSVLPRIDILSNLAGGLRDLDLWYLSLVGFLAVPAVMLLTIMKVFPWATAIRTLWRSGVAPAMADFTNTLLGVLLVAATMVAAPGLLALGLASVRFWDLDGAKDIARFFGTSTADLTPWQLDLGMHLSILGVLVLIAYLSARVALAFTSRLVADNIGQSTAATGGLVLVAFIVIAVLYSVVSSPAFATYVLGWILIALLAALAQRLGAWRWTGWDRQERRQSRSFLAGAEERRRIGRRGDAFVFAFMGAGFAALFIAIALRPWIDLLAGPAAPLALASIVIGIVIGIAMDAVNERRDVPSRAESMNVAPD